MRLRHVAALLCLAASTIALADEGPLPPQARRVLDRIASPRPIAVMVIQDPWAMVVGADTPTFVAYEDGQLVYLEKDAAGAWRHMGVRLDPPRLQALTEKLRSFAPGIGHAEQISLTPGWTDQPETRLYLDVDGQPRVTTVYGLGVDTTATPREPGGETPDVLPAPVKALHEYLSALRYDDATEWVPERVEVIVWSYDYAPEASIHWPKQWPGLTAPSTIKHDGYYSIYLPGSERRALLDFLRTRNDKGAVEIDGRKWSVSVRSEFPASEVWLKAFRSVHRTD